MLNFKKLSKYFWLASQIHDEANLQIKPNEVMEPGARIYIPIPIAGSRISKGFDTIPSGTLHPNVDEINMDALAAALSCDYEEGPQLVFIEDVTALHRYSKKTTHHSGRSNSQHSSRSCPEQPTSSHEQQHRNSNSPATS
ncbi:hypothetical protein Nepgr_021217 [Nepenthes gracilis]|uniref:Uncharacterized protein n=1 Tax=Nepenthes gracilis TaxID=150966 RepID=A0AAD3SYP5_NEPGR|nr:hypothetical protein Nepgr_021217 [Nepenthes gracilis]